MHIQLMAYPVLGSVDLSIMEAHTDGLRVEWTMLSHELLATSQDPWDRDVLLSVIRDSVESTRLRWQRSPF